MRLHLKLQLPKTHRIIAQNSRYLLISKGNIREKKVVKSTGFPLLKGVLINCRVLITLLDREKSGTVVDFVQVSFEHAEFKEYVWEFLFIP